MFSTSYATSALGIDLGTNNTLISDKSRTILLREPSVVALNSDRSVAAAGTEAKRMLGRNPRDIEMISPMREGVIADSDTTNLMLRRFVDSVRGTRWSIGPKVVICVPTETTPVEKRAVLNSAVHAGARTVSVVEEPMAAAVGAGLPVRKPRGSLVVDIGGGTTEIALISLCAIACSGSVRIGGNQMDQDIIEFIRRKHGLNIGRNTAERIKIEIGSCLPLPSNPMTIVTGHDYVQGLPRKVTISNWEVCDALRKTTDAIVLALLKTLERTPPELSGDVLQDGILLTGGGALLRQLDKKVECETGVRTRIAADPLDSVAMGAASLLGEQDLLRRVEISI